GARVDLRFLNQRQALGRLELDCARGAGSLGRGCDLRAVGDADDVSGHANIAAATGRVGCDFGGEAGRVAGRAAAATAATTSSAATAAPSAAAATSAASAAGAISAASAGAGDRVARTVLHRDV